MIIYVSTKWEEKDRAREIMALLKGAGHTISFDWTQAETVSAAQALLDFRGVRDADVVVCIFEENVPYRGALVEMGMGLALGKPIYVLGDALAGHLIFLSHPNVRLGENVFVRDLLSEGGEDAVR